MAGGCEGALTCPGLSQLAVAAPAVTLPQPGRAGSPEPDYEAQSARSTPKPECSQEEPAAAAPNKVAKKGKGSALCPVCLRAAPMRVCLPCYARGLDRHDAPLVLQASPRPRRRRR